MTAGADDLNRLALRQNGALKWSQLRAAGMGPELIRGRVDRGELYWVCRGAYTVADPSLLPLGRESAVLLSLGDSAVLSHRSAAGAWRLADRDPAVVDVTIAQKMRARSGVRFHRGVLLHPGDVTERFNLRITTPARTLIDFASQAGSAELERAFGEARAHRLLNDRDLRQALARAPRGHRGAALVRSRLGGDPGSTYTRSRAEAQLRKLLAAAQLPQPLVNVQLHGFTVDFLWPDVKLIVEVDGFGTHGDRVAFERDRRRDQVHAAAGYTVIRITWQQLCDEPLAVIARLAQALARRAA